MTALQMAQQVAQPGDTFTVLAPDPATGGWRLIKVIVAMPDDDIVTKIEDGYVVMWLSPGDAQDLLTKIYSGLVGAE